MPSQFFDWDWRTSDIAPNALLNQALNPETAFLTISIPAATTLNSVTTPLLQTLAKTSTPFQSEDNSVCEALPDPTRATTPITGEDGFLYQRLKTF
jgi:hypothetical protein